MNVLLLGNGLDLYYKLPTKYSNFLHIANYLTKHLLTDQQNIGDILSQKELQLADPFIKDCYEEHKTILDKLPINIEKLSEISDIVCKNKWFSYLLKSFNKDVGWIDFEQEIAFVIANFSCILPENGKYISYKNNKHSKYIVDSFGFLVDEAATRSSAMSGAPIVKKEFQIEHPLGSGNIKINKDKIASFLAKELQELSKALELYLSCFVDEPLELLRKENSCKRIPVFKFPEKAVTFNYTSTYEAIYLTGNAYHIHGRIGQNIVLGINPDDADKVDTADTSFIAFKKYFQRTLYETDYEYLRWISEIKSTQQTYRLIVMGHSLDITDKDIIRDLFGHASEIVVLFHNQDAKASYISNLVKIYGKDGFDSLRKDQSLTFLPLDGDLSELTEKINAEAELRWKEILPVQVI